MKLGTIKNNTRDGQLVVVSKDLSKAVKVSDIAVNMQAALDNWAQLSPKLEEVYKALNEGSLNDAFEFNTADAMG